MNTFDDEDKFLQPVEGSALFGWAAASLIVGMTGVALAAVLLGVDTPIS